MKTKQLLTLKNPPARRRSRRAVCKETFVTRYLQLLIMKNYKLSCILWTLVGLISCTGVNSQSNNSVSDSKVFRDYWYDGKAELTRYELEQVRYGETHKGDAVLIFVTEDFWTDKQVKYEGGKRTDKVKPILKLNFTRKFFTGIYPYSMMSSIFTPVDISQPTYKVTSTSQEWCGHTFSQLNYKSGKYRGQLFSYFQEEGDEEFTLNKAMLEDEIWTKIRLNPSSLPTGDIELIPGNQFLRLRHRQFGIERATASLENVSDVKLSTKQLKKYRVAYKDLKRVLEITFEDEFPYAIVAWEEQMQSGFRNPKVLTTRAIRTHSINSAYWGQHNQVDAHLRRELGLEESNY